VLVDDDITFIERGDGGAMMVEFIRVNSLITFNVDVGGATSITSSCEREDVCLRDVKMKVWAHTMMDDWVLYFLNSIILRKTSIVVGTIMFLLAIMVFTSMSLEMSFTVVMSAKFISYDWEASLLKPLISSSESMSQMTFMILVFTLSFVSIFEIFILSFLVNDAIGALEMKKEKETWVDCVPFLVVTEPNHLFISVFSLLVEFSFRCEHVLKHFGEEHDILGDLMV
jgi:hypothetical protein